MINEVILSRLDELIGEYDTPFFNYLIYSHNLSLQDCEMIISKIRRDISRDIISGDDNLVETVELYFQQMCDEKTRMEKIDYLTSLMDEKSDFYRRFLASYDVSKKDEDVIYARVKSKISEENITDFEIKRSLEYYFSNAVKQESYIRSLNMIVGKNYDTLIIDKLRRDYPNVYPRDIQLIANEIYEEIIDGKNFTSIKSSFLDKVMRKSESKKAEAISKWKDLVLGNGDSFNRLLELKNLTISDGENIKRDVENRILNGLICADRINGAFLTRLCIEYK